MKATTENERIILGEGITHEEGITLEALGDLNALLLESALRSVDTTDFTKWDSDALFALWTAKFGDIQHASLQKNEEEHYFDAVGAELFKRKLLTRVVDSNFCTLVPRGSNADR